MTSHELARKLLEMDDLPILWSERWEDDDPNILIFESIDRSHPNFVPYDESSKERYCDWANRQPSCKMITI